MKKILIIMLVFIFSIALYAEEKPIISVLDFYTEQGISKSEMRLFISLLSSALFQTKIYTVIDVSERESLLKEMEFSVSGCSDESCQLEIGRLLAAEAIIIGRIGRLGSRYVLSIKMLETDTGRAINTADGIYNSIDDMVDDVGIIADELSSTHRDTGDVVTGEEIVETDESDSGEVIEEIAETDEIIDDEVDTEVIPIEPTPKPEKRLVSYSVGLEGGMKFITGEHWETFDFGIPAFLTFDLELNRAGGKIGFGLISGIHFDRTTSKVPQPYDMITIPAGVNLKYESGFLLPFFFLVEAMGGMTFSIVSYTWEIGLENIFVRKPFAGLTAGVGFALSKSIHIAVCGAYIAIFTDNGATQGIAPLVKVEWHF